MLLLNTYIEIRIIGQKCKLSFFDFPLPVVIQNWIFDAEKSDQSRRESRRLVEVDHELVEHHPEGAGSGWGDVCYRRTIQAEGEVH